MKEKNERVDLGEGLEAFRANDGHWMLWGGGELLASIGSGDPQLKVYANFIPAVVALRFLLAAGVADK